MSLSGGLSATKQLKELLNLPGFVTALNTSPNQANGIQYNPMEELNDLNTCLTANNMTVRHSLPNNGTIRVDTSSTKTLFDVLALKVAIEGHESTNSYFTKIERLVDFNWEMSRNANWIAVNNRKPLIAYVISRFSRPLLTKQSNVTIADTSANQMIRIMNYETRHRCLAKGVFHQPIADLSFAINSVSSNSLDVCKLAVADKGGNVYIYSLKEENGEIQANQILEIVSDGNQYDLVRLSWCPYIPSEDDDTELEGDPGLTLGLSCDNRMELFSIDLLQTLYKESVVIEVTKLRASNTGYQIIDKAHDQSITSLSIAQEVTAICSTGLDDKIRFYSVALNSDQTTRPEKSVQKMFLKEWNLCNEYQYYERGDHFSNFFFLDDFDFLVSQPDPTFWSYGLIGTRKGHISIVNLKDWRCKQTIRLISEESSNESLDFVYRIDLTAHYLLAIRGNDAFLLHIHFPHDKEEQFDDCEPINNRGLDFDNSYPYVNKISRFQIYSAPLRSFAVKKSLDDNVMIFWITGQSLELCYIDLSLITIEESIPAVFDMSGITKYMGNIEEPSALNNINNRLDNSSNIPDKDLDLMDVSQLNGFTDFDTSLIKPPLEPQVMPIPATIPLPTLQTQESALNLMPSLPPPMTFQPNKSSFIPQIPRPESPASKEVQQIFSPTIQSKSANNSTNALKSMLSLGPNVQQMRGDELSGFESMNTFGNLFPSKLPNVLKDMVKEEQILQLKSDVLKEIQDSESRLIQVVERLDHKMSSKLNANNDQMISTTKVQTIKFESDLKEMKKELKTACKLRNDEFNKIVEKLVNKVMHEMNVIVQKGFQELMTHVNNELKGVTKDLEKNIQTMQTKLNQSIDSRTTHFQPLSVPPSATPVTPGTPITPQHPLYYNQTPALVGQRRTPVINATPSTTPLPFGTPSSAYKTPTSGMTPVAGQSAQILEQQKQQKQLRTDIWRHVAARHLDQALTKALNLRDPDFVVEICEVFKNTPKELIDQIKSDQLVLISLLYQILSNRANNFNEEVYWKTGFIEEIIHNLDFQNEKVSENFPRLTPKLIPLLEFVSKSSPDSMTRNRATVLAVSLQKLYN